MWDNIWGPVLHPAVAVVNVSWFGIWVLSSLLLSCHPKKNLPLIVKRGVTFPLLNRNMLVIPPEYHSECVFLGKEFFDRSHSEITSS